MLAETNALTTPSSMADEYGLAAEAFRNALDETIVDGAVNQQPAR